MDKVIKRVVRNIAKRLLWIYLPMFVVIEWVSEDDRTWREAIDIVRGVLDL